MVDNPFSLDHPLLSERRAWKLPNPADFLEPATTTQVDAEEVRRKSAEIEALLTTSNITARVVKTISGPRVTQYWAELKAVRGRGVTNPARYVEERRQAVQEHYRATRYFFHGYRLIVPVEGRPLVVFEIGNETRSEVWLRQVVCSQAFQASTAPLKVAMGVDVAGTPCVADLAGMPHLLVAGMSGSGKSVFLDGLIVSLLLTRTPDELRLVMITEGVELSPYRSLPHLLGFFSGIQERGEETDHLPLWWEQGKEIKPLLHWLEAERDQRLALLAEAGCADIEAYNRQASEQSGKILPRIVVFHEHFSVYEMSGHHHFQEPQVPPLKEVDPLFTRLAQTAHAAGIHLVITNSNVSRRNMSAGLLESFPARACFTVNNSDSSRRALGANGAEYLIGYGDYLYRASASEPLVRLHACHTTWEEAKGVVEFWKNQV